MPRWCTYLLIAGTILFPRDLEGQGHCAPPRDDQGLVNFAKRLAADTSEIFARGRAAIHIDRMPADSANLVIDEVVCAQAAHAYTTAEGDSGTAGGPPYTPARAGEYRILVAFDEQWQELFEFGS
jgi:hypothetical protein